MLFVNTDDVHNYKYKSYKHYKTDLTAIAANVFYVVKQISNWYSTFNAKKPNDTYLKTGAEICEVGSAIAICYF